MDEARILNGKWEFKFLDNTDGIYGTDLCSDGSG
jgi:hypothetical protein